MKLKLALIFSLIVLFAASCIKEEFDSGNLEQGLDIDGAYAIPIGFAELSLLDVLSDSNEIVQTDEEGFITLVYGKEVFSAQASEFFQLRDVSGSFSLTNNTGLPLDLGLYPGGYSFTDTLWLDLPMPDPRTRLDSIILKSGTLNIDAQSSSGLTGNIEFGTNNLIHNGSPFRDNVSLPSTGNSTDLSSSVLLPEDNDQGSNVIMIITEVILAPSNAVIPAGGEILNININLSSMAYHSVFGYLGRIMTFTNQESFEVELFDIFDRGTFYFKNPELTFFTTNSFGLPLGLYPDVFYAELPGGGTLNVEGEDMPDRFHPLIPAYPDFQEIGSSKKDSFSVNPNETNLQEVLERNPERFVYSFGGEMNPLGHSRNFITDSSRFSVFVELKLPLYGYADFILIQDTIAFELESILTERPEEIEAIEFRLNTINSFPVDLHLQVYFSDGMNILDSLFVDRNVVAAGMDTDADGKADPLENDVIRIRFDQERVNGIGDASHLIFNASLNTANFEKVPPENVKFYEYYFLDISMGAIVMVKAEL